MSKLPSGYTQLEYIEASGGQCIDTGFTVNKNDNYRMVLDANLVNNENFAGCNGYMQFQGSIGNGVRSIIDISYKNITETILVDGVLRLTQDWSSYGGANIKLGIFRLGDVNNSWYNGTGQSGKLYTCQIYKSGGLVRDLIPCKNASGAVGVYDVVSKQFLGNAGSGAFASGPAVLTPVAPTNLRSVLAVALKWDGSQNAVRYNVYRDGEKIGSTESTQYVDFGVAENKNYLYTVKSENQSGESAGVSVTVYTRSGFYQLKPLIESANFL